MHQSGLFQRQGQGQGQEDGSGEGGQAPQIPAWLIQDHLKRVSNGRAFVSRPVAVFIIGVNHVLLLSSYKCPVCSIATKSYRYVHTVC